MKDSDSDDFLQEIVPEEKRRGCFTMTMLWITMVTCFPNVLAGFKWFGSGMSLQQVVFSVFSSCAIVMLYCIPACYLGARYGLTYTMLCRSVFGIWGANLISANIIWISTGWYALNAIFLAEGIKGLFDLKFDSAIFAAIMALLMAVNNFFGFSGVANFARYLAAPVLLIWVTAAFFKSVSTCPVAVWNESGLLDYSAALTTVSSFVIGISCWGNEPDYWRFGKARWRAPVIPLAVALLIGQIGFPITGWIMARMSGVADFAGATRLMTNYVFGGFGLLAAAVLAINYVAVNDAGLYAAINASENLKKFPRKLCVSALAGLGAAAALLLAGNKKNFEIVAGLSSILLPGATVILIAEAFIVPRFFGRSEDLRLALEPGKLPRLRWSAVAALFLGSFVAALNSGFLPGCHSRGIPSLLGWAIALAAYLIMRGLEIKLFAKNPMFAGAPLASSSMEKSQELDIIGKQ